MYTNNIIMTQELKANPIQRCKDRVRLTLERLPKNFIDIIVKHYPKYNTIKGGILIRDVKYLRAADVDLTEIFENIANGKLTL